MAITKQKKSQIFEKLENIAKDSKTVVFVAFNKVTANEANAMRTNFSKEGVGYFIAKKTIIAKAFEGKGIEGSIPALNGEVAVAYGKDMLAPAQAINNTAKELKDDKILILGGVFDGKFISASEMSVIGSIPALNVLHTQLVTMLNSPIQSFVSVLAQIAEKKQ